MKLWKIKINSQTTCAILIFMLIIVLCMQLMSQLSFIVSRVQTSYNNENRKRRFFANTEGTEKAVLRFEPEKQFQYSTMPPVPLLGLKSMPENILVRMKEKREQFKYLLEPERIMGKDGLLVTREFQGNTWSGVLMRGALVFFVQSKASHYRRRMLLRRTWASIRNIQSFKYETVFVLRSPTTKRRKALLLEESEEYNDILQYIGDERTNGDTSTVFAGLQWAAATLPADFFYAFVADDTLINIVTLHDVMTQYYQKKMNVVVANDGSTHCSPQEQKIYCFEELKIMDPVEKYTNYNRLERSVNNETYSAQYWPPYCTEGLYIIPMSLAKDLYEESRQTQFTLPDALHDVLTTGILRRKLNRGDSNIESVTVSDPSRFLMRFQVLSRSRNNIVPYHQHIENRFKLLWLELYKLLLPKFHVYTPIDSDNNVL